MKKSSTICVVVAALLVLFAAPAFAGKPPKEPPPEPSPSRLVIVDVDGNGDFTSIGAALASITDNSATSPYLVKVYPGTYDVGATPITMKPYVDIAGSGQNVTTITGSVPEPSDSRTRGVVITCNHTAGFSTELRDLTIENIGTGLNAVGLVVTGNVKVTNVTVKASGADYNYAINNLGQDARLENVTATAFGSVTVNYGQNIGINNNGKAATMVNVKGSAFDGYYNHGLYNFRSFGNVLDVRDSEFVASGGRAAVGINAYDSTTELTGVRAIASNASDTNIGFENYVYVYTPGTAKVDYSSITGSPAIQNNSVNTVITSLYLGSSKVDGAINRYNTNVNCAGVYDGNYTPITCP